MATSSLQPTFSEQLEYGRGAEAYNRWVADQFLPYVGKRVLEVGCGIGNLSQFWADREAFVRSTLRPSARRSAPSASGIARARTWCAIG